MSLYLGPNAIALSNNLTKFITRIKSSSSAPIEPEEPEEIKEEFKFTIKSNDNKQYSIPHAQGIFNWIVDWGDNTIETYSSNNAWTTVDIIHTYPIANTTYQITIKPTTKNYAWGQFFGHQGYVEESFGWGTPYEDRQQIISLDSPIPPKMLCTEDGVAIDNFGYLMFLNCKNLTLGSKFQLPQNLKSFNKGICAEMFYGCSSITTGIQHFFGNLQFTQEQLDLESTQSNWHTFQYCFLGCTSITEDISSNTIPMLKINPSKANGCFIGCPEDKIINCPANWKTSASS